MTSIRKSLTAMAFLSHCYELPAAWPDLPMADEPFVVSWEERRGSDVLDFLLHRFGLPVDGFQWEHPEGMSLVMTATMGGRLPVIGTTSHLDFRCMSALFGGKDLPPDLPLTVNAFTMDTKCRAVLHNRLLLLNRAPYSNIPAARLGIDEEQWLQYSYRLRLRHECAHYETLRLLGGMRNHPLDEILADTLGQIAAFGCFDAAKQRIFFGLEPGSDTCNGRLSYYCQKLKPDAQSAVYRAVSDVLDDIADETKRWQAAGQPEFELWKSLASHSIAERLISIEDGKGEQE